MDLVNSLLEKLKNPVAAAIVALALGFIFGLVWGWGIQPVEWVDAAPELLNENYQRDYLRMTIDSFLTNGDTALATQRWQSLGASAPQLLQDIGNEPGVQNKTAIDAFGLLVGTAAPGALEQPEATPSDNTTSSSTQYFLIGLGILAVFAVGFFAFRLLRPSISKGGETTPAQQAAHLSQSAEQTDYSEMGLATPITQSMTSYVVGDDLYDESFSIESQAGEFMGEYGVGISDTIGVGDPKKVTALEIWLFDKNDIKTATKVLMSDHAFNDPDIRQRLEAKGELVVIGSQKQIMLETETLQLLVTVADLEYGSGPLPPSSYFDRATLELAIWPRSDKG
ncbi:MAG: hypothetical protein HN736_04020 [Anaerolineae bacterium]|jgi:hypothetical protein|nr:hypothetical protein [Anaerolineae bacterium]MBT3714229.1 hypothetical protein [Anaerolineae bacterium]MBT4309080.1 hypothetical protein [Anaerolineae bacterium]MBT4457559.1 hypothetical protein [Anaerolineae bacterium]MBT4840842.1 hypothetical protein [Anaerolineae bacterium]